jgi:phage portal protein BeeE
LQWLVSLLHGGPTVSGIPVSPDRAMCNSTVPACVQILSNDVAKLWSQFVQYEGTKRGKTRREMFDSPVMKLLVYGTPNDWMTPFYYWCFHMMNYLLDGNHYDYIVRNERGDVIEIIPIPSRFPHFGLRTDEEKESGRWCGVYEKTRTGALDV